MKIIKTIRNLNLVRKNGAFLQIVVDVFRFSENVAKEGKPMVCDIAMIHAKNGTEVGPRINLWAGIGEGNPIDRCRHLKAQNIELIRLLKIAREGNISEENKMHIDVTIKCFDK